MNVVKYYTSGTVETLASTLTSRLNWYVEGGRVPLSIEDDEVIRKTTILMEPLNSVLKSKGKNPSRFDAENALVVYEALRDLTPHQAADERLWTYLCHKDCANYVAKRWLYNASEKNLIQRVKTHFFVSGGRGLLRDNGMSRLWWLGYIAERTAPTERSLFLEIIMSRQDIKAELIDRTSVSRNYRVLRAVYETIKEHYGSESPQLLQRETFREWMKGLNRRGGMVLLDSLPDKSLAELINKQAELALNATE